MDNYLLIKESKYVREISKNLGFSKTYFSDDFTILKSKTNKDLLKNVAKCNGKVIFQPDSEEMLRFALERTKVDMILGVEKLHHVDHTHYPRSGLDQILCKIAVAKEKTIAFSFSEILHSKERSKLMTRMMFNIKLCKKYKVKMLFTNFSTRFEEMRSAKDLQAFFRLLGNI